MTIRIYRSMGVLAHEKSPVYTCNAPANNTPGLYDELTVELPAGWTAYETETGTVIVSPDGEKYMSYEVLRDYGDDPALVWYDGETYHHKLLREVTPDA